jgi:arylsulfatase A-like enzyme/Tfp pilus assembly protein PilF
VRPNVLVVTIDTLRADRLGCYGFGLAHTPAMDRLAAEGVRCTDVASSAPITLPAHSSIMTGLYPPAHGVRDNGNYALGPEAVTLAERLETAGYRTAAFVSAAVLTRRYGLAQGFDVYDDDLWSEDEPDLFMIRERPAARTADRALAWLEDWRKHARGEPFFLWVHFFDPHQPYDVRSIDLAALSPTPYDAEISEADRGVGRLVDWLRAENALDATLIVLTADHGESLGEHGEPTHGIFIYDSTIRVPLVWRLPRLLPSGATYPGPVRHVDVAPTVLAILGLPGAEATQGASLLAALQGRTPPVDLVQYAEARLAEEGFGMAPLSGVRHAGHKWIQAPRPELYDLRADPRELRNLHGADPAVARLLETRLEAVVADSARRALTAPTREIDRETEEMLRALGYLAPPEQRAEMAGLDPKDGMALYAKLQEARQHAQVGEWERTQTLLAEVLAAAPENVTARNVLALAAVRRGDLAEAERQYLASLAKQPRQHRVVGALGSIELRRGRLAEAERRFREALDLAPSYVEAMANLGWVEAARGNEAGAQRWYERAITVDPTYPHVYRRLADLYYDRRDWTRALEYYRRVLSSLPRHFEALVQAGNSARFAGDGRTAAAYYADAGRVRGDSWIPPYNLACLRAVDGDPNGALALLGEAVELGFGSPGLLDRNEDFAALRGRRGWPELIARVQAVAARTGGRGPS